MTLFTYPDLRSFFIEAVGENDLMEGDEGAVLDAPIATLGYDSLALLEVATLLERDLRLAVPDEVILTLDTPRAIIDWVNERMAVIGR